MIRNLRHKGLKRLFESGKASGIMPAHSARLRRILALLETAASPDDMRLPGLDLHELRGKRKGTWAVNVSGNWRLTFKLREGDAFDVDYEDYH